MSVTALMMSVHRASLYTSTAVLMVSGLLSLPNQQKHTTTLIFHNAPKRQGGRRTGKSILIALET